MKSTFSPFFRFLGSFTTFYRLGEFSLSRKKSSSSRSDDGCLESRVKLDLSFDSLYIYTRDNFVDS
jgi:hypothetical protein